MQSPVEPIAKRSALTAWLDRASLLALLAVLALHGRFTLTLFGDDPLSTLTNEEPILVGEHALHLYHGFIGSQAFRAHEQTDGYDPRFFAGYPKTCLFDAGSRPAELFHWLGSRFRAAAGEEPLCPASYKIGLAVSWFVLPVLMWLAGLAAGVGLWSACLCTGLGVVILNHGCAQ